MALESGFFNSVGGDRLYNAEDMSRYFENILSSGIFKRIDNCLKVSASGGMALNVAAGAGLINCHWFRAAAAETVTIPTAHAVLPRFDIVVARLDMSDAVRAITLQVVSGSPAESPVAPDPVRTTAMYDLVLALVYVPAGAASITPENLTDVRENEWYCGYVQSLVDTPILKTFHSRYTASANDTTVAPIGVTGFNAGADLLNVYINGWRLAPGIEYTINTTTSSITLADAIDRGTVVDFEVYRPVMPDNIPDAADMVTGMVQTVADLQSALSTERAERESAFAKVAPIGPGRFFFDGTMIVPGFISSNSQLLYFSIPFNRPIDALQATVEAMNVRVRQNGKYVVGGASTWYDISSALTSVEIAANGMLTFTFRPSFTDTPINNAECIIHIEPTATIEFL